MEKKVVTFFAGLIGFVALLGVLHYAIFGGFTGYALLKSSSTETSQINYPYWSAVAGSFFILLGAFMIARFFHVAHKKLRNDFRRGQWERQLIELKLQ